MRKTLLLLLAAMLLPLAVSAQPHKMDLGPNQKLLGHYTTDDITLDGCWGKSFLKGTRPIATDLTPDELAMFQGSKITAFRVGLSLSTPVTRVFVIPIYPNGTLGTEKSWTCNVSEKGWNIIELDEPYLIDMPADYGLRIGFDYDQVGSAKPISAVKVGTIYPTYCYFSNSWKDYGLSVYGNLSLQLVCENDNFPSYIIRLKDMYNKSKVKLGEDLNFSFKAYTLGTEQIAPGNLTFDVAVDGATVKTISNEATISGEYTTIADVISTEGLAEGEHTLTVTTATLNGEPLESPVFLSSKFQCFTNGFSRQMRLAEQFTSTYCTYCPLGSAALAALCDMRGDVAWVGVHQNMSGTDVFRTLQCDSIANLQQVDGYPEGSFDRTIGVNPENPNTVWTVLSYNNATAGANVFNTFLESVSEEPSWATVYINSTYDASTRKAVVTINGDLVPKYEDFMGNDSKLTVYITEDGLVSPQYNSGTWVNDYVHNGVLRQALVSVKGVKINKTSDITYKNEFTVSIPSSWNADNLNIVAFISRPLGNAVNDIYVTNTNKRKLGEFDEPTVVPGDANGDGAITIDDVTMIIDIIVKNTEAPAGADFNGDGIVSIDDITMILDLLVSGN